MNFFSVSILLCCIAFHVSASIVGQKTSANVPDCTRLANVDGFLIDLDGTMYDTDKLVTGALKFFEWLIQTNTSYVFVSNSAAKGPLGVQTKFATAPWTLPYPVSAINVWTAAQGIAFYLKNNILIDDANLFILQSTSKYGNVSDSCVNVLKQYVPRMANWTWRTDLSETEAKEWSKKAKSNPGSTYVVNCVDSQVGDTEDPVTHKPGYTDWNYSLISKAQWLMINGAVLVSSAPDATSPPEIVGDLVFTRPGGGALDKLLQAVTFPRTVDRCFNTGKGGNKGTQCMMQNGIKQLKMQGASGDLARTAMVGDTLYTDIEAGASSGMQAVFVLSGVSRLSDMSFFPTAIPTCILNNVGEIPHYASPITSATESNST